MTRSKIFPVFLHLCGWLLFMGFPLIFLSQGRSFSDFSNHHLFSLLVFGLTYIGLFYLNAYFLFTKFYLKKKFLVYGISVLLMFLLVYFIKPFDTLVNQGAPMGPGVRGIENGRFEMPKPFPDGESKRDLFPNPPDGPRFEGKRAAVHFDITSIFIFIAIVGLGATFQSMKQRQAYEKRAIIAEAERTSAELSFLKAQINPHFLYNTLNNIYTLCITNSEHAADNILKLSNIMRYVTDEAESDFVPLENELNCINNFIALQQLRLGKKVTLNYEVNGDPIGNKIPPMILMTFIENVFKYGLSNHIETVIDIIIRLERNKITLLTRNQIFEQRNANHRTGVGLANTKKRLEHLYADNYSLSIDDKEGFFKVLLVLHSK